MSNLPQMKTPFFPKLPSVLFAALGILSGCSSGGGAPGRYVVTSAKSPFYKYGPAQTFGPDFALDRGQKVTVVQSSFGFAKVTTDDGTSGYMPTDDLAPAPAEAAAQVRAPARTASRPIRGEETFVPPPRKKGPAQVESGLPLFDANDIPLPSNAERPKQ